MVMPSPIGASSTTRRLQLIVLANLPQFVMVATYLLYNSLLTIMVVELEWHSFAKKRKSLRVSTPRGAQRSTFYLSLPYRYSLPLAILSAGLQWLVSQSLFFAEVDLWDEKGERHNEESILTLGYSNLALFWLLFVGILAWLPVVGMGYLRRLPEGMPLLGACSGVVAAACHLPGAERDKDGVATNLMSWGVVDVTGADGARRQWLWFSGVSPRAPGPIVGEKYG
jgi:hypothetical protein